VLESIFEFLFLLVIGEDGLIKGLFRLSRKFLYLLFWLLRWNRGKEWMNSTDEKVGDFTSRGCLQSFLAIALFSTMTYLVFYFIF